MSRELIGLIVVVVTVLGGSPVMTYFMFRSRMAQTSTEKEREDLRIQRENLRLDSESLAKDRRAEYERLEQKFMRLQQENTALQSEIDAMRQRHRSLQTQVDEQDEVIRKQAIHITERDAIIDAMRERVGLLEDENQSLQRKLLRLLPDDAAVLPARTPTVPKS